MTIRYFTRDEEDDLAKRLPPANWKRKDVSENESDAYSVYKGFEGGDMQSALRTREAQQAKLKKQPFPNKIKGQPSSENWSVEFIPHMDNLIEKHKLPEELSGQPIYRGSRIDYGTSLIKSGKKPGDTIRDPRYQSFSIDPGTAMHHTSKSQFGDMDTEDRNWENPENRFKRKKKVLLEHVVKDNETGLFRGDTDGELEIIYPRNKTWKITDVRDEDVVYSSSYGDKSQNARIYTVERKKKKQSGKKVVKRKVVKTPIKPKVASKPVKKIKPKIIRKPAKKCKCKK